MTNALVREAQTRGYPYGFCSECGSYAQAQPGYPRLFRHVDRFACLRHPHHKYNWLHSPTAVTRGFITGLVRRVVYNLTYPWRLFTFQRKVRRASGWPAE